MILNKRRLAEAFGVSGPTINTWQRAGLPCLQPGRGPGGSQYRLADCIAWRVEQLNQRADSNQLTAQRIRLVRAQADRLQAEIERLKSTLVPSTEIARAWAAIEASLVEALDRTVMAAVPRLTGHDLIGTERIVRVVVRELRQALADAVHQHAEGIAGERH